MKKVLVLLSLIMAVPAFSQGTVNFVNKGITTPTGGIQSRKIKYAVGNEGPITTTGVNVDGTVGTVAGGVTWGLNARAALYAGAVGSAPSTFTLVVPAVGFLTGTDAGYWDYSDPVRSTVFAAAADCLVQARVWDIGAPVASYEAALPTVSGRAGYFGQSIVMRVTLGGGSPPTSPAEMFDLDTQATMPAFTLTYIPVPEPSIIGLGILGAIAGLFVFRRRS